MNYILAILFQILNNSSFQDTNYKIAYSLIENFHKIPKFSITQLSALCKVSPSRFSKFVKDTGHTDMSQFKISFLSGLDLYLHQIENRMNAFDSKKTGAALFALSSAKDLPTFYQNGILNKIVDRIENSKRIIIVGSIEMASLFCEFQEFFAVFSKPVLLDTTNQGKGFLERKEGDLICLCSMSGRLFRFHPDLLLKEENCFLISKLNLDAIDTIHIYSNNETFESYYFVSYYLDCLRKIYYERKRANI